MTDISGQTVAECIADAVRAYFHAHVRHFDPDTKRLSIVEQNANSLTAVVMNWNEEKNTYSEGDSFEIIVRKLS